MKKFLKEKLFKIIIAVSIFLLPLILTIILYPPKEKVIFNGKNYQQSKFKVEDFFQKEPTFKNLIADALSVSLSLDWYKITIKNNSIEKDPNCLASEPPIVKFSFLKGDPRKYSTNIKEGEISSGFGYLESKYPEYYLKSGEKAFFIAPSWEEYSINGGLIFSGECNLQWVDSKSDFPELIFDYDISIKPYLGSWLVKLFILFIFWILLLSSSISMIKWLVETNNRK